jgi:hypothetical protein
MCTAVGREVVGREAAGWQVLPGADTPFIEGSVVCIAPV